MTEQERKEIIEKQKAEICPIHPAIVDVIELLVAAGRSMSSYAIMCANEKDKLDEVMKNEDTRNTILRVAEFFKAVANCAKPFINEERGFLNMVRLILKTESQKADGKQKKNEKDGEEEKKAEEKA